MRMLHDGRFAVRNLTRSPGFTVIVVFTLALGIGASTAIFSVVNAVVLRPLDYPEPQRLVRITSELRGFGATDTGVSPGELVDYESRTDLFVAVAGLLPISANVTGGDTPERVEMMLVGWRYFSVLGVAPAHGRIFAPEDETPGVANIAVVSDGFWRRRLGADPGAVGRTIVIDEDPILVVGVMPPGFSHPGRTAADRGRRVEPRWLQGPGVSSTQPKPASPRRLPRAAPAWRDPGTGAGAPQRLRRHGEPAVRVRLSSAERLAAASRAAAERHRGRRGHADDHPALRRGPSPARRVREHRAPGSRAVVRAATGDGDPSGARRK